MLTSIVSVCKWLQTESTPD